MLMSVGIALCVTFLALELWRMISVDSVNLHRFRLKYKGSVTRSGRVFMTLALFLCGLTVHSGVVRVAQASAERHDDRVTVPLEAVVAGVQVPAAMISDAGAALRRYGLATGISAGGLGLAPLWRQQIDVRRAWLHLVRGERDAAEKLLRRALERDGPSENLCVSLATVLRAAGRPSEALEVMAGALLDQRDAPRLLETYVRQAASAGRIDEAIDLCRRRLERFTNDGPTLRWLALLHLEAGRTAPAIEVLKRIVQNGDAEPDIYQMLARLLARTERLAEAAAILREAIEAAPDEPALYRQMADVVRVMEGHDDLATAYRQRAEELERRRGRGTEGLRE
jgi:tetratricopeptide (TPR) repeat protein